MRAVARRGGAHQADLDLAWHALHAGDGHIALQPYAVGQQDAERGLPDRDIAGLIQRLVVEHHESVAGHQQQWAGRVVLEAHPAGPLQPGDALGDGTVRRHLQEARLQRAQAVEIGLDSREVRAVLWRGLEAGLCPGRGRSKQQRGQAEQIASVHAAHVAPDAPVCKHV